MGAGCRAPVPVILFTVRSLLTLLTILTDNAASCLERRKTKIVIWSSRTSVVHSHWSRNVEARLSLVESVAGASSLMP